MEDNVTKEKYMEWANKKLDEIESITSLPEIRKKIQEVTEIEFWARREWIMLKTRLDELVSKR